MTDKERICNLFRNSGTLYYSDIVEKTGIDLRTVVSVCDELVRDGIIGIDKEAFKDALDS